MGGALQVAVGIRLGTGEILAGEDGIDKGWELRVLGVDTRHLLEVAAGDDRRGDAAAAQIIEEIEDARDEGEGHLKLEVVETLGDSAALGFQWACEVGVVDLGERLPFDGIFEAWAVGVVQTKLRTPETGVLRFGIEDDAIEVKESGFDHPSLFRPDDGLLAVGSYGENRNGGLELVFEELDVVAERLRELVFGGHLAEVFLPAREVAVDGRPTLGVVGHVGSLLSVLLVSHAGTYGLEAVEDVGLHHDELGDAVDHNGVFQGYEVHPSAAAVTTRYGSVFMTNLADAVAGLVEEFHGEGTRADAGAVGLEDTIDLVDFIGTDAQPRADTAGSGGAGTDVRVCAVLRLLIFIPANLIPSCASIQPSVSHDVLCI